MIASTARRVAAKLRGSSLPRSSLNFLRRELGRLQEKFKKRSERIAELEKQVQEKEKELADAQKKIAEQEKQITDLERKLALRKRKSPNSSKPPFRRWFGRRAKTARPQAQEPTEPRRPARTPRASSPPDSHGRGERPKSAAAGTLPALRAKAAAKVRPSDNGGATTASGDGDSGD